jgi:hypothetical protein
VQLPLEARHVLHAPAREHALRIGRVKEVVHDPAHDVREPAREGDHVFEVRLPVVAHRRAVAHERPDQALQRTHGPRVRVEGRLRLPAVAHHDQVGDAHVARGLRRRDRRRPRQVVLPVVAARLMRPEPESISDVDFIVDSLENGRGDAAVSIRLLSITYGHSSADATNPRRTGFKRM